MGEVGGEVVGGGVGVELAGGDEVRQVGQQALVGSGERGADGLQRDRLDLDGGPSIVDTWKAVIAVQKTGKVKSIGVSNFTVAHLEKIIGATGVIPVMNQVEAHPALQQPELEKYCEEKGIKITAYSPLGNNVSAYMRWFGWRSVTRNN